MRSKTEACWYAFLKKNVTHVDEFDLTVRALIKV